MEEMSFFFFFSFGIIQQIEGLKKTAPGPDPDQSLEIPF